MTAERCIKDITEYANAAQDSQHRDDILLVVEDHRSVMKDIISDIYLLIMTDGV